MLTRRNLIQTAAAAVGGLAASGLLAPSAFGALAPAPAPRPRFRGKLGKLQLLQVGVGGSIAPADRHELKNHPDVVFTGFCDVDSDALSSVAGEFPEAFTCSDFREAFDKHGDKFDGVVVCTPDHNHALITLWAMRANKHVYAQKPLVQQLSEVVAIEQALAARPNLVTQTGNQRMGPLGRQHTVDILRRGLLGKVVESHVWVGGPGEGTDGYFWYGGLKDPIQPPANIDWQLWLGAAVDAPCRPGLIGLQWRSSWDYGTGQLGDWCTHLLDLPYFAFDLPSPVSVMAHTLNPSDFYHARGVMSTLTYDVSKAANRAMFARDRFVVRYGDQSQAPSRAELGLQPGRWPGSATLIVCEGGAIMNQPDGDPQVWIDGKPVDFRGIKGRGTEGEGTLRARNHWHAWVDGILGKPDAFVQTPFSDAAGIAEAGLLCSRAARFPQEELGWDKSRLVFLNADGSTHDEATKTCVRREYRQGFELPTLAG